jgi:hypothetical protein
MNLQREHWHSGILMAFSALDGPTNYEHGLVARTISDGIEICLPEKCKLRFHGEPRADIFFGGDFFQFKDERGVTVSGVFLDAHHLLIKGGASLTEAGEKISHVADGDRLLVGAAEKFNPELLAANVDETLTMRQRWLASANIPKNLPPARRRTLTRALTAMKSQVCSPGGKIRHRWTTPDRWPHRDMWLWDTAFHAIGWRHVDVALAMEMIEAMFDLQRSDGFLPYRGSPQGSSDHLGELVTQSPVLAHGVSLVYEKSGNREWLQRLYPKLAAYVEWDLINRDADGDGLLQSYLEDDANCRSSESGMDNSPRFDNAKNPAIVDFNSYAARECEALSELALTLGLAEDAKKWQARHERLCDLIREKLWSPEKGFYFDYEPSTGRHTEAWVCVGFLPLFCGAATQEQARRLATLLRDPDYFGTALPVPSVAAFDRASYSKDMWRGPVWINVNWMIAAGFERYGMAQEAAFIREVTVSEIERACEKFGTFFEYYDDRREIEPPSLFRKAELNPANPYRQVIHDYGWTMTLYVDLLHR